MKLTGWLGAVGIVTLVGGVIAVQRTWNSPGEYAYLAPYVHEERQWSEADYAGFLAALSPRHLVEVALGCGIDGVTAEDLAEGRAEAAVARLGGRDALHLAIVKDMLWDSSYAATYPMKSNRVPYHGIVAWAAAKKDATIRGQPAAEGNTTYVLEQALLAQVFAETWDKLNPQQRAAVIAQSGLSELTSEQQAAIIAGTGAAAAAVVSAAVATLGFSAYMAMSSAIASAAGALGLTLGFSAYTGASTALASLTGPVGWVIIGVVATGAGIYATGPNPSKTTQNILTLHIMKTRALTDAKRP